MNEENEKSNSGGESNPPQNIPREAPSNPLEKGLNENQLPDFQFTPPPPPPPSKSNDE
jgi:hypothetical protein